MICLQRIQPKQPLRGISFSPIIFTKSSTAIRERKVRNRTFDEMSRFVVAVGTDSETDCNWSTALLVYPFGRPREFRSSPKEFLSPGIRNDSFTVLHPPAEEFQQMKLKQR